MNCQYLEKLVIKSWGSGQQPSKLVWDISVQLQHRRLARQLETIRGARLPSPLASNWSLEMETRNLVVP